MPRAISLNDADVAVRKLHPLFGAELVDFAPSPESAALLRHAAATYGIVLLRNTDLSDTAFLALAEAMGEAWSFKLDPDGQRQKIFRHSNVDEKGVLLASESEPIRIALSTQLWHTDATYSKPMASVSMLMGKAVPAVGGNTQFCDTRVAYEGLTADKKKRVDSLVAHHSVYEALVQTPTGYSRPADSNSYHPLIRRPLARLHKESGRRALTIASHICNVEGLPKEEAAALVEQLISEATTPERVYTHVWRAGDIVLWDNRCTMHRATPYDYGAAIRDMRIVRVSDADDSLAEIVSQEDHLE